MKLEERLKEYIEDLKWDIKEGKKRIERLEEQLKWYDSDVQRLVYNQLIGKEKAIIETLQSVIDVEEDILVTTRDKKGE